MKDGDSSRAYEVVRDIYERHRSRDVVSPSWLATLVMREIGAERGLNELEFLLAHLQARHIARAFCRQRFENDETAERDDLFPKTLQHRYPRAPVEGETERVYVLRGLMTRIDYDYNISRLRQEASAKLAHADALEADKRRKFSAAA